MSTQALESTSAQPVTLSGFEHLAQEEEVIVVDDVESHRSALVFLLESNGLTVRSFGSPHDFLMRADLSRAGCLILDNKMAGLSGVELLDSLRRQDCQVPVIILTGHGTIPLTVKAMQLGALHLFEKPVRDEALLAEVRRAFAVNRAKQALRAEALHLRSLFAQLSRRECEVLQQVAEGFSSKEVAVQLDIRPKTVEVHRSHIMAKLKVANVTQLIRLYLRYRMLHPDAPLGE